MTTEPKPDQVRQELADEIEASTGLLRIVPGQGEIQLGIKRTAMVVAVLRTPTAGDCGAVREALSELTGAMKFVLAFYEPGQRHLDTEAWKCAEAGARSAFEKAKSALSQHNPGDGK